MQIELNEATQQALQKAAAAAGMSLSSYTNLLVQEQLVRGSETTEQRLQAVDALISHITNATSSSGRRNRRWREFIHEGHAE